MQYNVENLFDPYDDPDLRDEEFTPDGAAHWTLQVLDWKLKNLGEVITSIVNPNGSHCPDVLVLEEVENAWVAKRLKDGYLSTCHYKTIIIDAKTPDIRGIRNAVITKLDLARAPLSHFTNAGGRNILEVPIQVAGHELTVFANHWKSRITRPGDIDNGAAKRAQSAAVIRKRLNEMMETNPKPDVVVVGDMNDESEDDSIFKVLTVSGALKRPAPEDPSPLFWEPSSELMSLPSIQELDEADKDAAFRRKRGTYLYRGRFYQLDHILVSRGLFDDEDLAYQRNSFEVVRHPRIINPKTQGPLAFKVILDEDGNDKGPKGASDHFPLLVRINYSE